MTTNAKRFSSTPMPAMRAQGSDEPEKVVLKFILVIRNADMVKKA
jgi:hypothetical protein